MKVPEHLRRTIGKERTESFTKQATAYPRVEKLFGNHYKRVEETELRAVVMNLSGSIPANISGKPALLAHVEGILADQEMKEAASNTDSGLGDRPVPVPPAPVDTEQRHRAEITFNKGKLGFTVRGRTETGRLVISVADVNDSGQALGLGVQAGDRIVSVNGTLISDLSSPSPLEVQQLLGNATRPLVIGFEREGLDLTPREPVQANAAPSRSRSFPITANLIVPRGTTSAANWIRRLVSKKRHVQNGFDLDLTYILPRCIAMGYLDWRVRDLRNHASEVAKFLRGHHPNTYWVFNLCSERSTTRGSLRSCFRLSFRRPLSAHPQ